MSPAKLNRKQLHDLVWSEPMTALAKRYDISDVGLRKICIKMNIPLPRAGHWQKIKAGRKIARVELPSPESNEEIILQELEKTEIRKEYPWTKLQLEIESDPNINLSVPSKLENPDKLILSSKQFLTGKESKSYKFEGMVTSAREHLDITVEPKNVSRALLWMDSFIKLLRVRGHSISIDYRATYIVIKNERIKIQLREKTRIIDVPRNSWSTRELHPTGILSFKSEGYFSYEWKDGKRKLEEQFSNIIAKLEIGVNELHEIQRVNRERREEEEKQRRLKDEYKKKQELELLSFKKLLNKSVRWREVQILREFIAAAEVRAVSSDQVSDEFKNWLSWARSKADWYDPYLEIGDELLMNVDKESLTMKV